METQMPTETELPPSKKIAIVSGGSRGIGRSTVKNLVKCGMDPIFTYRSHSRDAVAVRSFRATAVSFPGARDESARFGDFSY
jgi:NAD(P)-dependent dehydrogenase (short-subunit alcohol dehydrogenase family)